MNALLRRCVARAGESPFAESCFHGNRVARFLSSSVASRGWSWKPVGREACLCGGSVHASVGFCHCGEVSDELGSLASSRLFAARVNEVEISNAGELNRVFQALPVFGEGNPSALGMSRQKATG